MPGRTVESVEQKAVVGPVEARRGQHAVRDAVRVEQRQVFLDRAVALRRGVPVGRERQVAAHHVRVAIDCNNIHNRVQLLERDRRNGAIDVSRR
jgi:hypothetical protein